MGLYVTFNGEHVDPEMFILLYMPRERTELVQQYLDEHDLSKKFALIEGELSTSLDNFKDSFAEGVSETKSAPIKTLVLQMRNEKVLFEYKLSQKHLELQSKITDYVNGCEEKD